MSSSPPPCPLPHPLLAPQSLAYCFLTYGLCSCGQLLSLLSSMHLFSTLGFLLFCLGTTYAARFRSHMRHRFNIFVSGGHLAPRYPRRLTLSDASLSLTPHSL